jgi:hypothetical protein
VAQVNIVEAAVLTGSPFRPDRLTDGAWVLGGALLAAALAMALVEAFNRPPPLARWRRRIPRWCCRRAGKAGRR